MTAYIALLRAVNVGGTDKLPMAELRSMCERLGFAKVRTYIASGNVVLESDEDRQRFGVKRPLLRQPPGDLQSIHALYPVKSFRDRACFVRLDAADEMPGEIQICEQILLRQRLLQVIFAEIRDAGGGGHPHRFGTLGLGHRDQSDRFGVPPGGHGGTTYPRPDVVHMKRRILRTN